MMSSRPVRLIGLGLISMGLASGCCCFESCCCSGKAFHRCSEVAWSGSAGQGGWCDQCAGNGCTGVGCGCSCHGCGWMGSAMGWCPDYPAMAAGWTPCCGPILNFFVGLRNAFASCGCGGCGPAYVDEWYNDPPACHDPCPGAYGPSGGCGGGPNCSCGGHGGVAETFAGESFPGESFSGDSFPAESFPAESLPAESWSGDMEGLTEPAGSCNCGQSGMSARPMPPAESAGPPRNRRVSYQPAHPGRRRPVRTVSHQDPRAPRQSYARPVRRPRRAEPQRMEVERSRPAADPNQEWDW